MGKVYTAEQIKAGRTPRLPVAHRLAAQEIMHIAQQSHRLRVMIHGSVAESRFSPTSDVDILAIYPDKFGTAALIRVLQAFGDAAGRFGLRDAIELAAWPESQADRGLHEVDDPYAEHLIRSVDESPYVHGTFDGLLRTSQSEHGQYIDALKYAARKAVRFAKAIPRQSFNADVMQRALELPKALERKLLASQLPPLEPLLPDTPSSDLALVPQPQGALKYLKSAANQYAALYVEAEAGIVSGDDYTVWLESIYQPALLAAFVLSCAAYDGLLRLEAQEKTGLVLAGQTDA